MKKTKTKKPKKVKPKSKQSNKDLIIGFVILILLVLTACIFKLKIYSMAAIFIAGCGLYPKLVEANAKLQHNNDRFSNLTTYMENMIIAFKKNPKILLALKSTQDYCEGEMRLCVEQAIYIIENDTTTPDVFSKALGIIESEFKTSRLKSLHKFLISVEQGNSVNYQENLDNLYYDIHSWVTRIFTFQKNLKDRKIKIGITIVASTAIVAYFVRMMVGIENSLKGANLTGGLIYQIGTTVFLIVLMGLYTLMQVKLNGVWMVEDMAREDEQKLYKKLESAESNNRSKDIKNAAIAAIVCAIPVMALGIFLKSKLFAFIGIALAMGIFFVGYREHENNIALIKKELIKEFPGWLRDISVNLQNMVVVKAITESSKEATPLMKEFSQRFLTAVEKDPVSMGPYNNFFGKFEMPELRTSIKTLYSMHNLSDTDAVRQISDLTVRNQDLISRSEELRLNDSIAGIGFLTAIPMLAMSFKLMGDMSIMLLQFMTAF